MKVPINNWRLDLRISAPEGNILAIPPCDLDPATYPILHNFAVSYLNLYGEHSTINSSYKEVYIFSNPDFTRGPDTVQTLDHNFFGDNMHMALRTIKFCDYFVGNRLKTAAEFLADGIQFTAACWMRLQAALISARNRLQKKSGTGSQITTC